MSKKSRSAFASDADSGVWAVRRSGSASANCAREPVSTTCLSRPYNESGGHSGLGTTQRVECPPIRCGTSGPAEASAYLKSSITREHGIAAVANASTLAGVVEASLICSVNITITKCTELRLHLSLSPDPYRCGVCAYFVLLLRCGLPLPDNSPLGKSDRIQSVFRTCRASMVEASCPSPSTGIKLGESAIEPAVDSSNSLRTPNTHEMQGQTSHRLRTSSGTERSRPDSRLQNDKNT